MLAGSKTTGVETIGLIEKLTRFPENKVVKNKKAKYSTWRYMVDKLATAIGVQ